MRLRTALVALIAIFPTFILADSSRLSADLSYQTTDFATELRLVRGYKMNMHLFSLNYKGKPVDDEFVLTMKVPVDLIRMGFFTFKNVHGELPLSGMDNRTAYSTYTQFSMTGNHSHINELLSTLSYERASRVDAPSVYQIEYILSNNEGKYDHWTQSITFPSSIGFEALQNTSSTVMDPGADFKFPLFKVTEDPMVEADVVIRMHSAYAGPAFFTLTLIQGVVFIQGRAPTSMHQTAAGKYTTTIVFEFYNAKTGDQSGMLTYYLELNPAKVRDSEIIAFYIYGSIFAVFFLSVVGFVIYAIKRDHQLKKESIRNAIAQPETPQENVLTRSILEWTKHNTSTRDQTEKGQVSSIMSSNDRFALKKGKKPTLQYKGLKQLTDKDHTANQTEDNSVEMTDNGKLEAVADRRTTAHLQESQKELMPMVSLAKSESTKEVRDAKEAKAANERRQFVRKTDNQFEFGEMDKEHANFKTTQRDLGNLSQFGISVIGYVDESMNGGLGLGKFNADISASGIGMNQIDEEDPQGAKEDKERGNLNLEEMNIILKDL